MNPADRLEPMAAVLSVAEGLDTMVSVQRAIDAARTLTQARYAALGLFDEAGNVREFIYRGITDEQRAAIGPLPTGRGIVGLLARRTGPLRLARIADHSASVGFPPHHPAMTSFLGSPIVVDGETLGSLYLADKDGGGEFTAEDEAVVGALAGAVGVAMRNARTYERTRQRERWQRAATMIDYAVLSGSSALEVLQLIAAEARRLSGADVALVGLPEEGGLILRVVDVRNALSLGDARWSVDRSQRRGVADDSHLAPLLDWLGMPCGEECLLEAAFATGETMLAPGWQAGPSGPPGADAFATAVAIPMRSPDRSLGVLGLLWDHEVPRLTAPAMEVAEAFAAQAGVTLMLADALRGHEQLMVLRDRDRIARDMHDLVVQRVFATGMSLQSALRTGDVPERVRGRIERAIDDLDETITEIRRTIFDLRHEEPAPTPVLTRSQREAYQAAVLVGFAPDADIVGPLDELPAEVSDHLLAAVREGLSNVARHARATSVMVAIRVTADEVALTVTDDGTGPPAALTRRSGLANLAARAAALGGESSLQPAPSGAGSRLLWRIPRRPRRAGP